MAEDGPLMLLLESFPQNVCSTRSVPRRMVHSIKDDGIEHLCREKLERFHVV